MQFPLVEVAIEFYPSVAIFQVRCTERSNKENPKFLLTQLNKIAQNCAMRFVQLREFLGYLFRVQVVYEFYHARGGWGRVLRMYEMRWRWFRAFDWGGSSENGIPRRARRARWFLWHEEYLSSLRTHLAHLSGRRFRRLAPVAPPTCDTTFSSSHIPDGRRPVVIIIVSASSLSFSHLPATATVLRSRGCSLHCRYDVTSKSFRVFFFRIRARMLRILLARSYWWMYWIIYTISEAKQYLCIEINFLYFLRTLSLVFLIV